MVKYKIIWSQLAKIKLYEILKFFAERNRSKTYSEKLYRRFNKELKLLLKQPDLGLKTEMVSVRGLVVEDYIIFYESIEDKIIIHTLWDCRQDPDKLKIK